MSRPPINPEKSAAGIALDPVSLTRVIPESKRPDGTVRKQLKVRPGFTPQEDVKRFRGTKQEQMDQNKGYKAGWVPKPETAKPAGAGLSKSAKKNAKRKEKRDQTKDEAIKDNWDDSDEDTPPVKRPSQASASSIPEAAKKEEGDEDKLVDKLEKLSV